MWEGAGKVVKRGGRIGSGGGESYTHGGNLVVTNRNRLDSLRGANVPDFDNAVAGPGDELVVRRAWNSSFGFRGLVFGVTLHLSYSAAQGLGFRAPAL